MFAVSALESSFALFFKSRTDADKDLLTLCRLTVQEWKRKVGPTLPALPSWEEDQVFSWQEVRALQRHPLWIVMDAIGITMTGSLTRRLVERLEQVEANC